MGDQAALVRGHDNTSTRHMNVDFHAQMLQDASMVLRQISASNHACRDCARVKEIDVTADDDISVLLCCFIVLTLLSAEGKSYV